MSSYCVLVTGRTGRMLAGLLFSEQLADCRGVLWLRMLREGPAAWEGALGRPKARLPSFLELTGQNASSLLLCLGRGNALGLWTGTGWDSVSLGLLLLQQEGSSAPKLCFQDQARAHRAPEEAPSAAPQPWNGLAHRTLSFQAHSEHFPCVPTV